MDDAEAKREAPAPPKRVNLDHILLQEVGQFGWYQARVIALAALIAVFTAWAAGEYVFTTARTPSRCFIEECDGAEPDFRPDWIEVAVPPDDNCARYENSTSGGTAPDAEGVCPAHLFDTSATRRCDGFVYGNTYSVVSDYGLECDEWRRSLIGSLRTLGTLTALPFTGYVSDRWGRRTALALNAFNTAWLGLVRYWANTYVGFIISEFVEAHFGSGGFSCAYILVMELVGPRYRVAAGATLNTFFSVGQVLLGLIARAIRYWRPLTLALYAPQVITLAYFWVVAESVRWLLSKGRYEQAERVLKNAAAANGRQLSDKALAELRDTAQQEEQQRKAESLERAREPWLPLLVVRSRPLLLRCLVSPVWWVSTTFIYYGLNVNSINMAGDSYFNYMAVSAIEIPGYWTAVLLLDLIGRRPVLILAFWICAACQFGYIFLPEGELEASLALYLIGKYCIAMVMTSIYVYTAELYPTKYRHSLFAFSSMMGRLGSVLAPLTPALAETVWHGLPFVLFGGFAFLSGSLVFVTPETRGTRMPDTMQDAEQLGRHAPTAAPAPAPAPAHLNATSAAL